MLPADIFTVTQPNVYLFRHVDKRVRKNDAVGFYGMRGTRKLSPVGSIGVIISIHPETDSFVYVLINNHLGWMRHKWLNGEISPGAVVVSQS